MAPSDLNQVLFLDIETVPQFPDYSMLPENMKKLWNKKAQYWIKTEETDPEESYAKAGIYAEFGRIICISVGMFNKSGQFVLKSFYGDDEMEFLPQFVQVLNKHEKNNQANLCAHNGKEFDFPYLARRILINGVNLPDMLNVAGRKPWETRFIDTLELWKFGDYKNYTPLNLLTAVFGLPSPKTDIDGSEVAGVYYKEKDLTRIVRYCERDVIAVAQLLMKLTGVEPFPLQKVVSENLDFSQEENM